MKGPLSCSESLVLAVVSETRAKLPNPIKRQSILSRSLSISVHRSARHGSLWVGWHLDLCMWCPWLCLSCPFPRIKTCGLSLTGTFGRIFHGVLLDEKDPSKEKQVFVKTVKGMCSILAIMRSWLLICQWNENIVKSGSLLVFPSVILMCKSLWVGWKREHCSA